MTLSTPGLVWNWKWIECTYKVFWKWIFNNTQNNKNIDLFITLNRTLVITALLVCRLIGMLESWNIFTRYKWKLSLYSCFLKEEFLPFSDMKLVFKENWKSPKNWEFFFYRLMFFSISSFYPKNVEEKKTNSKEQISDIINFFGLHWDILCNTYFTLVTLSKVSLILIWC